MLYWLKVLLYFSLCLDEFPKTSGEPVYKFPCFWTLWSICVLTGLFVISFASWVKLEFFLAFSTWSITEYPAFTYLSLIDSMLSSLVILNLILPVPVQTFLIESSSMVALITCLTPLSFLISSTYTLGGKSFKSKSTT